jgi:biotin carboxylase
VAAVDVVADAAEAVDVRPQVLLVAPRDSYRTAPYIEAARKQGVDLLIASEGRLALAGVEAPGVQIDLHNLERSLESLLHISASQKFSGVIGTDDASIELSSHISRYLGFPHNSPESVRLARRKDLARERLAQAGVPVPSFWRIDLTRVVDSQIDPVIYPCVAKPLALSASRGVIRANDRQSLLQAIERIRGIVSESRNRDERDMMLVEEYLPGTEVAVEALLTRGKLEVLAIFDKPEPLEGPYFEESYYITPSRHSWDVQDKIAQRVAEACRAYGLCEGPVHAECRINESGVWILEVAARTIGGLCGRLLRFGTGYGLEELVLNHALGRRLDLHSDHGAAGVLMIPIPQAGVLRRVEGVLAARRVPHIEDVVIDVREGYELVPLPEGASYLGFIFAHAPTPAEVETALRAAHAKLKIVVAPMWKVDIG